MSYPSSATSPSTAYQPQSTLTSAATPNVSSSATTLAPPLTSTASSNAYYLASPSASATSSSTHTPSILDKPITRGTSLASLSAFSYLFSEMIQYCQTKVDSMPDLEKRLHGLGYGIGLRSLELLTYRSSIQSYLLTSHPSSSSGNPSHLSATSSTPPITLSNISQLQGRKEKNLVTMLQYLHSTIWKSLFGRVADGLEKATDKEDEYYIYDREPITNKYISIPKDTGHINCAIFLAGIINGILNAAQFTCEVSAHFNTTSNGTTRTVYVIRFEKEVTKREEKQ